MQLELDLNNPQLILPEDFDAKALLPVEMHEHADSMNFLMHLVAVNRGGRLDFDFIDEITGSPLVTEYLFAVLEENDFIKPTFPPQEFAHASTRQDETPQARRRTRATRHASRSRLRRRRA